MTTKAYIRTLWFLSTWFIAITAVGCVVESGRIVPWLPTWWGFLSSCIAGCLIGTALHETKYERARVRERAVRERLVTYLRGLNARIMLEENYYEMYGEGEPGFFHMRPTRTEKVNWKEDGF